MRKSASPAEWRYWSQLNTSRKVNDAGTLPSIRLRVYRRNITSASKKVTMTASANWALYATFLSVMHHGSLSAAARALGTAQPTVRKQIAELEAALGCVLFTRSKAGLVPTETAHAAYPFAETMAATANALAARSRARSTTKAGWSALPAARLSAWRCCLLFSLGWPVHIRPFAMRYRRPIALKICCNATPT